MEGTLESTRGEWAEGYRRLQAASSDRAQYERLLAEVALVLDQLRRRVGQTFTLGELASAYGDADRWVQEALLERRASAGLAGPLDDRPGLGLPPLFARRARLQAMNAYQRRRRKSSTRRRFVWAVIFVLVFAIGIALGQALEDNPPPASTVTHDQTITLPPESATVTVTTP